MYYYQTDLSVNECKNKIQDFSKMPGCRCKITKNKLYIYKTDPFFINSYMRIFYGKIIERDDDILIIGDFKQHILNKIINLLALLFSVFLLILPMLRNIEVVGGGSYPYLLIIFFLIFIIGANIFAKNLNKPNEVFIIDYFENSLKFKKIDENNL